MSVRSVGFQNLLQICRIWSFITAQIEALTFQGNVIDIGIDIVDVLRIQDKVASQALHVQH